MIDHRNVGVGWVRVERLTLSVVEVKLFICVSDGQQVRCADCGALLGHTCLQTLKVVSLSKLGIVHVAVFVAIFSDVVMESDHGIVIHHVVSLARYNAHHAHVKSIVELEAAVLVVPCVFIVHLRGAGSATEALLLTILVNAPQVFHSLADGLLIAVLAEEVRSQREESNILCLELEDSCIKYEIEG